MKDNSLCTDRVLNLIDNARSYEIIKKSRWINGTVQCPFCGSIHSIRHGHDTNEPERKRYRCTTCLGYFGDLACTIFEGRHQSQLLWIFCLYFMGFNLSNLQITRELDLDEDGVQHLTQIHHK